MQTLLTPVERRVFGRLNTPQKIQDYLDALPINFELSGETYMSPRRVLKAKTVHCFEGALLAAATLAYHGKKALLMDLKTIARDEDHVVALFKENGRWGAISKTNHTILRYRDPIYLTPRELALSYVNEYIMADGRKSMRSYSGPFDLAKYPLPDWLTAEDDLIDLVNDLDDSRHFPIAPEKTLRALRPVLPFEIKHMAHAQEWPTPKHKRS